MMISFLGRGHHIHIHPILLMFDQTPLLEDVIEEDVNHDVVAGVYFLRYFPVITHNVLGIQRLS